MQKLKKSFVLMTLVVMSLQLVVVKIGSAFAASPHSVVINEIAWAGSADGSADEWIELYNTTNQTVDLSGWYIEDDNGASTYTITTGEIAPHGYFLIEDSEGAVNNVTADFIVGLSLANAGDSLILKDDADVEIDIVNGSGGVWYAGNSTSKATMEKIDPGITADVADNWSSAIGSNGAQGKDGSEILGTPRGANSNYGGGGASIAIVPVESIVGSGDDVVLEVNVEDGTDLYAYGFEINYDPDVLSYVSSSEADFLNADGTSTAFNAVLEDGVEGTLVVGNARLLNPPLGIDGSGKLFEMTFHVEGADGASTQLTFGGGSFLSDSIGDLPAAFEPSNVTVGEINAVDAIGNAQVAMADSQYSLELTWSAGNSGADSYLIEKQLADGSYANIGMTSENFFTDDNNLVPHVAYSYKVTAIKGGLSSLAVALSGVDTRGIKGDLDRSNRVDGKDLEKLARSFGSGFGDEEYNSLNDTTYDGIIDGSDLIDLGANFGITYSL